VRNGNEQSWGTVGRGIDAPVVPATWAPVHRVAILLPHDPDAQHD